MSAIETEVHSHANRATVPAISDFIPALDGLRAVAILWVILHNACAFPLGTAERPQLIYVVANAGWVGVQLFFALSGFLITRILLRTRDEPQFFRTFYVRRALRILPLCYAFLFVSLVVVPLFWPSTEAGPPFQLGHLWAWSFLYNWSVPLGWPSYGVPHFWSLAVEEQFYLVWPFVVHRLRSDALLKVCCGIAVVALCARTLLHFYGGNAEMIYEFTTSRMDALSLGAVVAILLHLAPFRTRIQHFQHFMLPGAILLFGITALATDIFSRDFVVTQTIGQSALAVSCALLVFGIVLDHSHRRHVLSTVLSSAPMRTIGRYSFGMYVLHFPIAHSLTGLAPHLEAQLGPIYLPLWYALIVVLTLAAAWISFHLLERPFLEMRKSAVAS